MTTFAGHYPEDVFPPLVGDGPFTTDQISAAAIRHACGVLVRKVDAEIAKVRT